MTMTSGRHVARGRGLSRLEGNALALMVATVMTAVLGLAFWAVAARTFTTAVVGSSSAMLSAASLLSAISLMNLQTVFQRYLPVAGTHTRRIVLTAYLVVVLVGIAVSTVFVASPFGSTVLIAADHAGLLLVALVAFMTVFTLQDGVLVGLRVTKWVPVENTLFAAAKVALLPVFGASLLGIVFAWGIPLVIAIAAVSTFLFGHVIPRHIAAADGGHGLPHSRDFLAHAAGEYVVGMATFVMPLALPLLVVYYLGPEANAYFYVSWIINSTLNLLVVNVTTSLLVEAVHRPEAAHALVRRAATLAWGVAILGSLTIIVFAPLMLAVMGPEYVENGVTVSRVLAIAVPFNVVNLLFAAVCRIERRIRWLMLLQSVNAVLIIVGAAYMLPRHGVVGLATAYASVLIVSSFVVALPLRRALARITHGVSATPEPTPDDVSAGSPSA